MKQLRISFAMGGGVSLGTFSGSSLTEAIKLILLEQIRLICAGKAPAYSSVTVDSFSGASAGTLSLALMLRGLCCPTPAELRAARQQLAATQPDLLTLQGDLLGAKPAPGAVVLTEHQSTLGAFLEDLAAAQVAQNLQDAAWVQQIDISNLLPADGPRAVALRHMPSILDQDAVSTIVRELLLGPLGTSANFSRKRLIGDRALFGASIANITPLVADARRNFAGADDPDAVLIGLADGGRSDTHREMRVFDLHFTPQAFDSAELDRIENVRFPFRWFLAHPADAAEDQSWFDLRAPQTWQQIALTAMASGAFPFAFPPIPLERYAFEFGYNPRQDASEQVSTWPQRLRETKATSFTFTYVDGGTFNNEPIREAFRMGSYLDGQHPATEPLERLVIFVDPAVDSEEPALQCGVHRLVVSDTDDDGAKEKPYFASSLDRLLPHAGQLIGAVLNEGRGVEADKIFQVRDRRKLRKAIGELVDKLAFDVTAANAAQTTQDLATDLEVRFKREFFAELIPALPLDVNVELERQIRVLAATDNRYAALQGQVAQFRTTFPSNPATAQLWIKVLLHTFVDYAMNLGGKDEHARLIAIAPFDLSSAQPEAIRLLGAPLFAFYGFFDRNLRTHDFAVGRHCAGQFLRRAKIITDTPLAPLPTPGSAKPQGVETGLRLLAERVINLAGQSHLPVLNGLDFPLLSTYLKSLLRKALRQAALGDQLVRALEIRVRTQDRKLEFDGRFGGDRDPVDVEGTLQLVTTIDCICRRTPAGLEVVRVDGYDLQAGRLNIDRDGIVDRDFARLNLPPLPTLSELLRSGALGIWCDAPTNASTAPVDPEWHPLFAGAAPKLTTTAAAPDAEPVIA